MNDLDDNPFTCSSCGVPFKSHHGIIRTCKQLQEAKQEIERLREMIKEIATGLGELDAMLAERNK